MKIKDSPQVTSCWLFLNNYNDARNNECKKSPVSVATRQRYGMYDSVMVAGLTSEQQQIVFFSEKSLRAWRPPHPPIQWVPEATSPVAWA